ncbi:hypothetical protein H0E87_003487, partial [Populus deltoides]
MVAHGGGFSVAAAGCGGKCRFFFFSPLFRLCCLLTLFFLFPPVNGVSASLQWLRGGAVGASGASGGGEEEDGP